MIQMMCCMFCVRESLTVQCYFCTSNFLLLEAVDKTLNGESEFVPTKHSLFSQPTPVEFKRQGECC